MPPQTRLPSERLLQIAERVGPELRRRRANPDDNGWADADLVLVANGAHTLAAADDLGMVVLDDTDDRAALRASWAAMSTALYLLSEQKPLPQRVLTAVPPSHMVYLLGHQARAQQLRSAWKTVDTARQLVEQLYPGPDGDQQLCAALQPLLQLLGSTLADTTEPSGQ